MTFVDFDTVTSSPESEAGLSPSISPAGPTTNRSGQDLAPANPSALPGQAEALTTPGTSGLSGSPSSASAALQSSLESRLKRQLGTAGSTLFRQTWKAKATPSGRPYWAHTASAHRTSDNDSGSWPTPRIGNNGGYGNGDRAMSGANSRLEDTAQIASSWPTPCSQDGPNGGPSQGLDRLPGAAAAAWPTTTTRDWKSTASNMHGQNARPLNEVARLAVWNTPAASDGNGGKRPHPDTSMMGRHPNGKKVNMGLASQVHIGLLASWPTPQAGTPAQNGNNPAGNTDFSRRVVEVLGPISTGSPAATAKPGQLNPVFSLWLMGYPAEWASCGARAIPSSRKSPQSSSGLTWRFGIFA